MKQQVLFRLDDICEMMDYEKFLQMKIIFDNYKVKPIIGVVPNNEDKLLNCNEEIPGFWALVRKWQCDGWTIAQHGYNHVYVTSNSGLISLGNKSEFAGLSYEEQYNKIKLGQDILLSHGIKTDVFMAPSHSYDKNTLKALKACGFEYVTDGRTNCGYKYMGLTFIPCKESKPKVKKRFSTVCLHTNWTKDKAYIDIERFLSQNQSKIVSFEQAKKIKMRPYFISRVEELVYLFVQKYIVAKIYFIYKKVFKKKNRK